MFATKEMLTLIRKQIAETDQTCQCKPVWEKSSFPLEDKGNSK